MLTILVYWYFTLLSNQAIVSSTLHQHLTPWNYHKILNSINSGSNKTWNVFYLFRFCADDVICECSTIEKQYSRNNGEDWLLMITHMLVITNHLHGLTCLMTCKRSITCNHRIKPGPEWEASLPSFILQTNHYPE